MRNYELEFKNRVEFIKNMLEKTKASGIVFGNSGGKDSALVGILCKAACENTVGIIMPCCSQRNFGEDMDDGKELSRRFGIETRIADLTEVKNKELEILKSVTEVSDAASANIAPRLRMITLYTVAASENRLVAGTGNRSEAYMGYFTKWGDGACDFNPIADLTATEVFEFLRYLNAPSSIIEKAPSAGLFEGQTDEKEMGVSYSAIDRYITEGKGEPQDVKIINRYHLRNLHKRKMPEVYACFEEDLK